MADLSKYLAEKYGAGPAAAQKPKKKKVKKPKVAVGQKIVDLDIERYVAPASVSSKKVIFANETHVDEIEDEDLPLVVQDEPETAVEETQGSTGGWITIHNEDDKGKDSDQSPPRRGRHDSDGDQSPPRRGGRHDSDEDQSPPRRGRHDSEDDQSPPRRRRHDSDEDQSPPRRGRHDSDNDQSPPRRQRHDSDGDQSPPRKRHDSDADQSPPRRGRHDSDGDQSPPRRRDESERDLSPPRKKPVFAKGHVMSDGGASGLVAAVDLKNDLAKRKEEQDARFRKATTEETGRHAETIVRDKSGHKLADFIKKEKAANPEAQMVWGRGQVQLEEQLEKQRELEEESKSLNYKPRYADDERMNDRLRERDRWGDPMAGKVVKKSKLGFVKPEYKGAYPPNRFNIPPGYRWDGVVRSTGFEKKYFEKQAQRQSNADIAYKWSTQDM